MRSLTWRFALTVLVLTALTLVLAGDASAQCASCPAPTVAYQPVVAQPVVAQPVVVYKPYTGWYPGKWFDQRRMRRAAKAAADTAAYTAAYTPTYTAASAPTYTAAYRPYVTAYAPLAAPAAAPCSSCTQTSYYQTAYYPIAQTVARPVMLQPVLAAPACSTCSFTPSCGCDACSTGCDACSSGCSACSAGVGQAVYSEPACASCAAGPSSGGVSDYSASPNVGPQTPAPSLRPVPEQSESQYRTERPIESGGSREVERPAGSDSNADPIDDLDPGPAGTEADSSTYYNAPRLLDPRDRTARSTSSRRPTVNVWKAVYRKTATNRPVSHTDNGPVRAPAELRTQAEIDADGWSAVPRKR